MWLKEWIKWVIIFKCLKTVWGRENLHNAQTVLLKNTMSFILIYEKKGYITMFTYIPTVETEFNNESHLNFIKKIQTLKKYWLVIESRVE